MSGGIETLLTEGHHSFLVQTDPGDISRLVDCEGYSTLNRLLRVTKLVLRFMRLIKEKVKKSHGSNVMEPHPFTDIDKARTLWLLVSQAQLYPRIRDSQPGSVSLVSTRILLVSGDVEVGSQMQTYLIV